MAAATLACVGCGLDRPAHLVDGSGRCVVCRSRPRRRSHRTVAEEVWRRSAACRDAEPAIFFPEPADDASIAEARSVCGRCEVRSPCLDTALAGNEVGVWAGTTEGERRALRHSTHGAA